MVVNAESGYEVARLSPERIALLRAWSARYLVMVCGCSPQRAARILHQARAAITVMLEYDT